MLFILSKKAKKKGKKTFTMVKADVKRNFIPSDRKDLSPWNNHHKTFLCFASIEVCIETAAAQQRWLKLHWGFVAERVAWHYPVAVWMRRLPLLNISGALIELTYLGTFFYLQVTLCVFGEAQAASFKQRLKQTKNKETDHIIRTLMLMFVAKPVLCSASPWYNGSNHISPIHFKFYKMAGNYISKSMS